eukprot:gene2881-14860_t
MEFQNPVVIRLIMRKRWEEVQQQEQGSAGGGRAPAGGAPAAAAQQPQEQALALFLVGGSEQIAIYPDDPLADVAEMEGVVRGLAGGTLRWGSVDGREVDAADLRRTPADLGLPLVTGVPTLEEAARAGVVTVWAFRPADGSGGAAAAVRPAPLSDEGEMY